jgi:hypothetical protein
VRANPVEVVSGASCVHDEQELALAQAVNEKVINDSSALVQEKGVSARPFTESGDISWEQVI